METPVCQSPKGCWLTGSNAEALPALQQTLPSPPSKLHRQREPSGSGTRSWGNSGVSGFSLASTLSVGCPNANLPIHSSARIVSLILFQQQPHKQLHWQRWNDVTLARGKNKQAGLDIRHFYKPSFPQRKIKSQSRWSNSEYLKGYM